jgi:hypothetical protein
MVERNTFQWSRAVCEKVTLHSFSSVDAEISQENSAKLETFKACFLLKVCVDSLQYCSFFHFTREEQNVLSWMKMTIRRIVFFLYKVEPKNFSRAGALPAIKLDV